MARWTSGADTFSQMGAGEPRLKTPASAAVALASRGSFQMVACLAASRHLDRLYVCDQRFHQRKTKETLVPRRLMGGILERPRRHRTPHLAPQSLTKSRYRSRDCSRTFLTFGSIRQRGRRQTCSKRSSAKCLFPGACRSDPQHKPPSATCSNKVGGNKPVTRVQNRIKTVHVKPKASERRAKFDLAEAMRKLNTIGNDFSRVQVGKGRFTHKCCLCFLRGEHAFLKQLLNKPCSAALHNVVPLPAPFSVSTPDEPESFFIGDTPSSEEDPFGWGGDFDQDHQAMSDQNLLLSPDTLSETVLDSRLSGDPASAHMTEDAVLAVCAPGTSEVL